MKNIYIRESQLHLLKENDGKEEITFYEFFINVKSYLKDLLTKPSDAKPNAVLLKNIDKDGLMTKMKELGIIKKTEKIDETYDDEKHKKVAKYFVQYKVPKRNFEEKIKELYKDIISVNENTKCVFSNEQQIVDEIKAMDNDNAYKNRGGLNEEGEGGGATSCGSVMQGGGANPDAGQYTVPFGSVQRRKFYGDTLKRNKDEKNGSISMNRNK